ncbi:hypothetical protein Tco_0876592, partial [Tanacetum coccineum]
RQNYAVDVLFNWSKLITKIDSLETELKQTKLTMGKALVKLVKKVKKMEDVLKRRHVVLPDSEDEDAEISSKQGRNLQEEGLDEMVRNMMKDKLEVLLRGQNQLIRVKDTKGEKSPREKTFSNGFKYISTCFEDISMALKGVNTVELRIDLDLFKLAIVLQKVKQIQDFRPTSGIRASRGTLITTPDPYSVAPQFGVLQIEYQEPRSLYRSPPSPDYILGPEEPQSPPSPDFVPKHVHPEFMPPEDEILPAEEQLLPAADSPTSDSPGYILESDPEEDSEEDDDEDLEEDPADYPADGGDDGDDKDEPSDDDEDEEVDIEADDEEEEEHPAPADSTTVALPTFDQAPSAEETEPFETDKSAATPPPHPAYRVTARIFIPAPIPTPVWSDAEVARLLAISTPSSSPLFPWSSPMSQIPFPPLPPIPSPSLPVSPPLPQISSPPLPVSSPVLVLSPSPPASPIYPLAYRAVMIWLRAEAASTSYLLPLPPPIILSHTRPDAPSSGTPPLHLLSTDRRADRTEVTLPPQKRLGIAFGPRYEVGERSSSAAARPARGLRADHGFVATMDREIRHDLERDVGYGITDS